MLATRGRRWMAEAGVGASHRYLRLWSARDGDGLYGLVFVSARRSRTAHGAAAGRSTAED